MHPLHPPPRSAPASQHHHLPAVGLIIAHFLDHSTRIIYMHVGHGLQALFSGAQKLHRLHNCDDVVSSKIMH